MKGEVENPAPTARWNRLVVTESSYRVGKASQARNLFLRVVPMTESPLIEKSRYLLHAYQTEYGNGRSVVDDFCNADTAKHLPL